MREVANLWRSWKIQKKHRAKTNGHVSPKNPKARHRLEQAEMIQKTVLDYDKDGDVLYISFGSKPYAADDSDVTDEGVIVRLKRGKIIGLTIPNAKKRISILPLALCLRVIETI